MKITFNDEHINVQQVAQIANAVLANEDFYTRIHNVTKFYLDAILHNF